MLRAAPVIFWFRRDLRLSDHPALEAAAARGSVLPVFVLDPALLGPAGANRVAFLMASLGALDADLAERGTRLVIRARRPGAELRRLAAEVGATRVVATDDHGPYGRRRDTAVGEHLSGLGMAVDFVDSAYAIPPGNIVTGGGTPYRVFTPFFKAWKGRGWPDASGPAAVTWFDVDGVAGETLPEPAPTSDLLPAAGEQAARRRLEAFLADDVADYDTARNDPGADRTSRLSPYLKYGQLHPRQLLARLDELDAAHPDRAAAHDIWRSELAWREFYAEVLWHRPETARHSVSPKMSAMRVDTGPLADERFAAWSEGRTGYPIVDAGMRQLVAEGWMHNRVRMIVASFLVKDLHLDWTRGARFFMEHLVDGDLASNQHGWQWVAGTGTDAAPYFRIFNPVSQGKKFDPGGLYVRRWVPEIAHLPDRDLHEPWTCKAGAPAGYPGPMVDHAVERAESLARLQELTPG